MRDEKYSAGEGGDVYCWSSTLTMIGFLNVFWYSQDEK